MPNIKDGSFKVILLERSRDKIYKRRLIWDPLVQPEVDVGTIMENPLVDLLINGPALVETLPGFERARPARVVSTKIFYAEHPGP